MFIYLQKSRILPLQSIARQSYYLQPKFGFSSDLDKASEEKEKELERISREVGTEVGLNLPT